MAIVAWENFHVLALTLRTGPDPSRQENRNKHEKNRTDESFLTSVRSAVLKRILCCFFMSMGVVVSHGSPESIELNSETRSLLQWLQEFAMNASNWFSALISWDQFQREIGIKSIFLHDFTNFSIYHSYNCVSLPPPPPSKDSSVFGEAKRLTAIEGEPLSSCAWLRFLWCILQHIFFRGSRIINYCKLFLDYCVSGAAKWHT